MKALKTAIFAATMMSGATAMAAEVSGNVAIGSDYFFRGFDQSLGEALSGGFDVGFENGLYVWNSITMRVTAGHFLTLSAMTSATLCTVIQMILSGTLKKYTAVFQ